jgi:outer membrane protein assembly factor BamD
MRMRVAQMVVLGALSMALAGCNLFGPAKIKEEPIIPPDTLYNAALNDMDAQRYNTAIDLFDQLERQHP